ncbi:ThiF family protein, ubiquitin-activating enzyme [Fibrella aestuarina BUZ 2]|uniref:ThiF family protein, ubiquitin-activating enzyme n=1 Tax=Fibrella aestuarina BUZ 2 TaxID=1166018 RepID=I0KAZ0_9BACT|nr:PRTRC system ThiF family protein [Fibrella aestuarina]CCH01293.1 ThiF family protein, ubiquitin-activating enzyme [Fibrella aestuarina BUZ 2]
MTSVHLTAKYLISPQNPITVNLIGAGGTGSQVLTALARMNVAMLALGHPGLYVCVWDHDTVSRANMGRQLFAQCEVGQHKAVALINRTNRFFGTNWKAIAHKYEKANLWQSPFAHGSANVTISCVDTVAARFQIADTLKTLNVHEDHRDRPYYWMDFGNSLTSGQVMLSTVGKHKQPDSKKFKTVAHLPFITDEYADALRNTVETNEPSCSLAEALERQDLFINPTLAQMGCKLLWNLFREGMTPNRGFFLNLADFRSMPLPV